MMSSSEHGISFEFPAKDLLDGINLKLADDQMEEGSGRR